VHLSIRKPEGNYVCGGTLISTTHILTAAHCFGEHSNIAFPPSNVSVRVGDHNIDDNDVKRVKVKRVTLHPGYNKQRRFDNDFVILDLATPVTFSNKVRPACLPADRSATFVGVTATITGWGRLGRNASLSNVLRAVDVRVTNNAPCDNFFDIKLTDNMICGAGSGKNHCSGDSGGPVVTPENGRQALIGVVSFSSSQGECGTKPQVYARVTAQMDWILENTAGTLSSACDALN